MIHLQNESDLQWQKIMETVHESTEISSSNFDAYFIDQMSILQYRQEQLIQQINSLEEASKIESDDFVKIQILSDISTLKIELSNLNIDIAQKKYSLYQEFIDNMSKFQDADIVEEINQMNSTYDETISELKKVRESYYNLKIEIDDNLSSIRDKRIQRLSIVDFLYFSFTISLASPFGDILPNNIYARSVTVIQLFLNIVLLGVFISKFTDVIYIKQPKINHKKNKLIINTRKIKKNIKHKSYKKKL